MKMSCATLPLPSRGCTPQAAPARAASGYMGSLGFHINGVERLAAGHEQSVALAATKAHVGTHLWQQNLTDAVTIRGKDVHAVKTRTTPSSCGPEVAVHVDANAVGHARQPIEDHQRKR